MEYNILDNKLVCLISFVNPSLQGEKGIRAAIHYRVNQSFIEIDSSEMVRKAYEKQYGKGIPESADTIFNAFIPFLDFCRAKLIQKRYRISGKMQQDLVVIDKHLDEIFDNYYSLRVLFDRYFELMYSFSNFMPVPKFFNGTDRTKGKGTFELNKDYPSVYYNNLLEPNSGIYKREQMKKWIDSVMETYRIKRMYEIEPPYPIKEYYGYTDEKLELLIQFVNNAIKAIEDRFSYE